MTIHPKAIEELFERPRKDSRKAKEWPRETFDELLEKWAPGMEFVYDPYLHQLVCFLLGVRYSSYYFALDMGTGKSKISLDILYWRISQGEVQRVLILVPGVANLNQWVEEAEKHYPELHIDTLDKKKVPKEKEEIFFQGKPQAVVCTYAGLLRLMSGDQPAKLRAFIKQYQMIIADEATAMQNHMSKTFQLLRKMCRKVPYRYSLSGTPVGKNKLELWPQIYFIDHGYSLGEGIGLLREALFNCVETSWGQRFWNLPKANEGTFQRWASHRMIRYSAEECLDLPRKRGGLEAPMIRGCPASQEQWVHLVQLQEELREMHKRNSGKSQDKQEREAFYYKFRAVAAGYVPSEIEGVPPTYLRENPKLDLLLSLLDEVNGEKVIVVTQYKESADIVYKGVKAAKYKAVKIVGSTSSKEKALKSFKNSAQILVANSAIAYGLNLQHARFMFFFETLDNLKQRQQIERRIHRGGQTKPCVFADLVLEGSTDRAILNGLKEGKSGVDAVIDRKRRER